MLRKNCVRSLFVLFIGIMVLFPPLAVSAAPDPTEQFRPFLAKVMETLIDPELKDLPEKEKNQRIMSVVREHFDFGEMSKRVVGKQWQKFSPEERTKFEALFIQLLHYIYIDKIDEYSGQQVQFTRQRIKGRRAEVQTVLVDKNKSIPVSYIMQLQGNRWMAYDVVVEGLSLVRTYKDQFNEILRKDGYLGLVKQIEEKITELEKGVKKS